MSRLHVLSPGLYTTIQDFGRFGYQAQGVPVAGVLDPVGLRLANALVGNREGEAGLEICALGPRLSVDATSLRIAVCGPIRLALIRGGEERLLGVDRSHLLLRGDVLALGGVTAAATAVLAVEGGFDLLPVMGSLSTYVRAGIGPLGGKPLVQGSVLPLRQEEAKARDCLALAAPFDYGQGPIRVMAGPQAGHFTPRAMEVLLSSEYRVGKDADRMGVRLDGPELEHVGDAGIASDGLVSGCIQVPGNGHPIVLLADHQTVGGYAKIATVISADLPRLGRVIPGTILRFQLVNSIQAQTARRNLEQSIQAAVTSMTQNEGSLDLEALYRVNLVSGVIWADS